MFLFVPCSFCSTLVGEVDWGGPESLGYGWVAISGAQVSLQGSPLPRSWQLQQGDACSLESAVVQLRAGSLPLQMVRMTPWLCQASSMSPPHMWACVLCSSQVRAAQVMRPPHMWGPADRFFSPPEVSFCCSLVENERLGDCTLLSCDSHLQPQALSQGSGMNPKGGITGED